MYNNNLSLCSTDKNSPGSEKVIKLPFQAVPNTHSRFRPGQPGYDLCFLRLKSPLPLGGSVIPLCLPEKDFSENILMEDDKEGLIAPGPVRHTYMSLDDCREHLNISISLNNKMFCMRQHQLGPRPTTNHHPPTGEGEDVAKLQSSQTNQENQAKPRTQQTTWDNEDELLEYAEDIAPSPEEIGLLLNSTVTPTEHSKRAENLTNEIMMSPKQKDTPKPPAESLPTKTDKSSPSTAKGRDDCEFLSGTPVASVKGKTAFVTGLMLTHDCSEGLVFTKLSRFLPWLESMLERP